MKKNFWLVPFIALVVLCSCGSEEEPVPTGPDISEEIPAGKIIGMGEFESFAHSLAGKAVLLTNEEGNKIVRLENFTMTEGPDVFVLLSKSNNYSKSNVLEVIKLTSGYNMSEVNFDFQSTAYSSDYRFVLVYCVQYNSLFGFAELK
jgi:Electron transfer DM13